MASTSREEPPRPRRQTRGAIKAAELDIVAPKRSTKRPRSEGKGIRKPAPTFASPSSPSLSLSPSLSSSSSSTFSSSSSSSARTRTTSERSPKAQLELRTYTQGTAPLEFDMGRAKVLLALVLDNRQLVDNDVTRNYLIHHTPSLTLHVQDSSEHKTLADPDATLFLAFDRDPVTLVIASPFAAEAPLLKPPRTTSSSTSSSSSSTPRASVSSVAPFVSLSSRSSPHTARPVHAKKPGRRRRDDEAADANTFMMRERRLRGFAVGTRLVWADAPPTLETKRYAAFLVEALFVDTKRLGIGTQLLHAVGRHALQVTDRGVALDTIVLQAVNSPAVLAFYRAAGFVVSSPGQVPTSDETNTIWMECPIATLLRPKPD